MTHTSKLSLIAVAVSFVCLAMPTVDAAKYEVVTSTKAIVARDTLESLDLSMITGTQDASTEMYTPDKMNAIVENLSLEYVVKQKDKCQFTSDIEDRARLVKSPVFMYAWGEMLLKGICVQQDKDLALGYIRRAADEGYAPAMVIVAQFYERGTFMSKNMNLSEQYMHTAAALGSKSARLGWADMLIRGYGDASLYEEAYAWLYHTTYEDEYSKIKKEYLENELKKHLPANVIARNQMFEPDY